MHRWRTIAAVATAALVLAVPIVALASGSGASPSAGTPTTLGPKPTGADPAAMDPEGLVPRAREGLVAFAAAYPEAAGEDGVDVDLAQCPLAAPSELTAVLAPIGDARPLEPALGASLEVDVGDEGRAHTVACDTESSDPPGAGPIYGLGLAAGTVADLGDLDDFAEYAESVGATVVGPSAATFGGTVYLWCEPDDSDPDGTTRCFPLWLHRDLLVAMFVTVDADAEATTLTALEGAFVGYLPVLLQRLAGGLPPVPIAGDGPCADPTAPGCVEQPSTSIAVVTPSTSPAPTTTAPKPVD